MIRTRRLSRLFRGMAVLVLVIAAIPSLTACNVPDDTAIEVRRRAECLNKVCPGDSVPEFDEATEAIFKRGGRWFIGPKEYSFTTGRAAFYWPSKTPKFGPPDKSGPIDKSDCPECGEGYDSIAVDFVVETSDATNEPYYLIEQGQEQGKILRHIRLSSKLERFDIKDDVELDKAASYYVATNARTPRGKPPTVYCRHGHPTDVCTGWFVWKTGFAISIRFNQRNAMDWPDIYSEIIRVLNQVREA